MMREMKPCVRILPATGHPMRECPCFPKQTSVSFGTRDPRNCAQLLPHLQVKNMSSWNGMPQPLCLCLSGELHPIF